jgi:hypothetical protein
MFRDDERAANQDDSDASGQPLSADAVLENLRGCRRDFTAMEGQQQERRAKYTDGRYKLAGRIAGSASQLRESPDAWALFIASPDWAGGKPPKRNQQSQAIRHAVRFMLPHDVSRQVRSYWTIPLQALSDEGIAEDQIAKVIAERGGLEAICKALRKPKVKPVVDGPERVKLFRKTAADIPQILRDAAVVKQADGKSWLEDGSQRRLLILAVQPGLLGSIVPGELELKAILGDTDRSVLELTSVTLNHPAKDFGLKKNSAVHQPSPLISGGSDFTQPLEP